MSCVAWWPDGEWCELSELAQFAHRSDDYELVDERYTWSERYDLIVERELLMNPGYCGPARDPEELESMKRDMARLVELNSILCDLATV